MIRHLKYVTAFLFWTATHYCFGQTKLNGNKLTLADGRIVAVGSYMKIARPSRAGRFVHIFNELSLRSSTEDDLPYGVSGSIAGKEVTVKRFLTRKGLRGDRFYVVTGGSFINNAIDIEAALKDGEVLLPQKRPVPRTDSVLTTVAKQQDSVNSNRMVVSGTTAAQAASIPPILSPPVRAAASTPLKKDSASLDSLSNRFSREFKRADSMNKTLEARVKTRDTVTNVTNIANKPVAADEPGAERPISSSPVQREEAHGISTLLTVPKPESVRPVEPTRPASSSSQGYEKYGKLKQLKELFDAGVLSKAEFEAEKKKVLAGN